MMLHHGVPLPGSHPFGTLTLGLPNPLQDCPCLQQLLWVIHRQQPLPQLDLGCQGITTDFLCRARPLHCIHLPKDRVLWAALTMGHHGQFHSGELAQPKLAEARAPQFICMQDVTPHFSRGCLHYICILLTSSKMDPFHQGCPVIIGCMGTPVCSACEAWHLLQQHQWTWTSPEAPFFQINNRALDHVTLVRHIKDVATQLGLNPSRYSGHSICIGGATSVAQAGLSQWQIKLMGCWNSQAYRSTSNRILLCV